MVLKRKSAQAVSKAWLNSIAANLRTCLESLFRNEIFLFLGENGALCGVIMVLFRQDVRHLQPKEGNCSRIWGF